jgi:hypothetical protein
VELDLCPETTYQTVGVLYTGDGTNFTLSTYVNGMLQGTSSNHAFESVQRRQLFLQMQPAADLSSGEQNFGTVHYLIRSVKVLTCANWKQSRAAGMCTGTTLDNGGFYR